MIISVIYGIALLFAVLIVSGYLFLFKNKEKLFLLLFTSIAITNFGYFLTSLSANLEIALLFNTLSYFGSVFLPMLMLLILLESLEKRVSKTPRAGLIILSGVVFLVTATQLIPELGLYYKEVSLGETADGASYLIKEYGPLHTIYPLYLAGYFLTMIYFALRAIFKKEMDSGKQTFALIVAVFINLCVWLAEQFTNFELEFLAISYLISELFLLLFRQFVLENQKLKEALYQKELEQVEKKDASEEEASEFLNCLKTLTPTEKIVLEHYANGLTTAQTLEAMYITQNTLKYHNKNLYSKCYVSSRKELLEKYRRAMKLKEKN